MERSPVTSKILKSPMRFFGSGLFACHPLHPNHQVFGWFWMPRMSILTPTPTHVKSIFGEYMFDFSPSPLQAILKVHLLLGFLSSIFFKILSIKLNDWSMLPPVLRTRNTMNLTNTHQCCIIRVSKKRFYHLPPNLNDFLWKEITKKLTSCLILCFATRWAQNQL